ncbi:hypothetical protein B296_00035120 [Ensete ventricosum]|uniref:Uncharacterized protein n=1 Tax=Ensete ventricosum TaxID=4639 RepID=A0A426XHP5_ENSVE|nr:hypothetical protein B296_00035120 [Ensete ventricosum]
MLDKNQHQIDADLPGIVWSSSHNFISSRGSSLLQIHWQLDIKRCSCSPDAIFFSGTDNSLSTLYNVTTFYAHFLRQFYHDFLFSNLIQNVEGCMDRSSL